MLKTLKDKVIVEILKQNKSNESGLVLAIDVEEDSYFAKVISVSDEYNKQININSLVVISKFAGTKIKYKNAEYLVVSIEDILAIVEEE